jgi:hypothetical protein
LFIAYPEPYMKNCHQPSGLTRGLDFLIDADRTPAQALAVVELLEDLRDRIWAHYELKLYEQLREARLVGSEEARLRASLRPPLKTARAVFPHAAFTKELVSEMQSKELIPPDSPTRTRRRVWLPAALSSRHSANA